MREALPIESYRSQITRKQRVIVWLTILGWLVLVIACVNWVVLPAWWQFRLNALLGDWRKEPAPDACRKLIGLLDEHRYGEAGNEVLRQIISPKLCVRSNYLVGRRVFASLESGCVLNPPHLLVQYSTLVLAGNQVLDEFETQSSLNKGGVANFQFTNGLRSDGKVVSLTETGHYQAMVIFRVKLLPEPGTKWVWPGSRSFPWKLLPERVALKTGKPLRIPPVYECEFPLPVNIWVVSRGEVDPVEFLSNPDLDRRVREAFRVKADTSRMLARTSRGQRRVLEIPLRDGISISYENLPTNVAFRMSFREANGNDHRGSALGSIKRAGESGVITAFELYYDVLGSLTPGGYSGDIILSSDAEAGYEVPGITTLWSGTLTFPVSFSIDSPQEEQESRRAEQ